MSKQGIGDDCFPHIPFHQFPVLNPLRTFDHNFFTFCCLIGNTVGIARPSVGRLYPLPIFSFMDNDRISRHRKLCCLRNRPKRLFLTSLSAVTPIDCHMIFSIHSITSTIHPIFRYCSQVLNYLLSADQ